MGLGANTYIEIYDTVYHVYCLLKTNKESIHINILLYLKESDRLMLKTSISDVNAFHTGIHRR